MGDIVGNRCDRCGRMIAPVDRDNLKITITPELFFMRTGKKPIRTVAYLCGRCNNQVLSSETKAYDQTIIEIFCNETPDFQQTWRKELEEKDLLVIFNNLQQAFLQHGVTDTCVRDRFTTGGYVCKCEKPKMADCDNCLRNWLRSTHPRYIIR